MKDWILIDYNYREKLPKNDCKIWITRTWYTGERMVQKVDYHAELRDIEWDGTIAWMKADENNVEPVPCKERLVMTIQWAR